MLKTKRIKKSQIIGKKPLGVLYGMEGCKNYNNVVITYLYGDIPILICTNLKQDEWNNLCDGTLTPGQRIKLSKMGVI